MEKRYVSGQRSAVSGQRSAVSGQRSAVSGQRSAVSAAGAALYLGDCRKILPTLGPIDLILSDPPYGIAFEHGGYGNGPRGGRRPKNNPLLKGDTEQFDPSHLLKRCANVMLFGAEHFADKLPRGRLLAWDKLEGRTPFGDSFADVEYCWHSRRGAARIFRFLWKGICRRQDPRDGTRRLQIGHKPVALMEWLLQQSGVAPGGLVIDPYMGSGTTGLACLALGYRFVGIEIDRQNFEIARGRIEAAQTVLAAA